jgi:hypothetical protein
MRTERWAPIAGFPYEVSTLGAVRRIGKTKPLRTEIHVDDSGGKAYAKTTLHGPKDTRYSKSTARLVAETFLGPCPLRHKLRWLDENRLNVALDNLAWVPLSIATAPAHAPDWRPRHKVAYKAMPAAEFPVGVPASTTTCPRCAAPVIREAGCIHCVMCGRLFPIAGTSVEAQMAYEAASGLRTRRHALVGA